MRVRSRRGFSLVEVMVVLAILGVVSYYGMTSLLAFLNSQKSVDVKITLSQLRENIRGTINNSKAWANTVAANADMACLGNATTCSAFQNGTFYMQLRDGGSTGGGAIIVNSPTSTAGFMDSGAPCNTWSATGNVNCPIRIRLTWKAVCRTTGCVHPQIYIEGFFEYSIPDDAKKTRTPINLANYDIRMYKSEISIYEPLILQYFENDNTGEGACNTAGWVVRKINRIFLDSGGNIVTPFNPAANAFTLVPGTYTCNVSAPSFKTGGTNIRLMQTAPTSAVVAYGRGTTSGNFVSYTSLETNFTIIANTTFQIEQSCSTTGSTSPYGTANSNFDFGVPISIPTLGYGYDIIYTTVNCVRIN